MRWLGRSVSAIALYLGDLWMLAAAFLCLACGAAPAETPSRTRAEVKASDSGNDALALGRYGHRWLIDND